MIETKFFYFPLPADVSSGTFMAPVGFYDPGFIAQHGEGWEPIDHTIFIANDQALVSIMANRTIDIPEAP